MAAGRTSHPPATLWPCCVHLVSLCVACFAVVVADDAAASCRDHHQACKSWAETGECEANPGYMLRHCMRSCFACHGMKMEVCEDKVRNCGQLTHFGECLLNTSAMIKKCPTTCRMCGEEDPCLPAAGDAGELPTPGALDASFERIVHDPALQGYGIRVISEDPWIIVFDSFLNEEEVDEITGQFQDGWKRSSAGGLLGEDAVVAARTSEQIWCETAHCEKQPGMNRLVSRVEKITKIKRARFEDTQVLRYLNGQEYRTHNDFIDGHTRLACGPRIMTFFVYLSDAKGAGTRFEMLDITVEPKKGRAVLWQNVQSSNIFLMEERTMHAGLPAKKQPKLAANVWIHPYDFRRYNNQRCFDAGRPLRYYAAKTETPPLRSDEL
eukprot:TRINITY_DN29559_c0_g1_i1.p1 TRINITY_DN29559_c0_g1~~TRINITY_DN29559_c0_g1_i1.p1  ORF type:complete len:381 (-),score=70.40 TRINITY_DN29559_c0_g1_i1:8-1150(-)